MMIPNGQILSRAKTVCWRAPARADTGRHEYGISEKLGRSSRYVGEQEGISAALTGERSTTFAEEATLKIMTSGDKDAF